MYVFATKNSCPYCSYVRFWKIRREKFKCKKCRREWSLARSLAGVRATEAEWQLCLSTFLKQRPGLIVARETGLAYVRVHRMLTLARETMAADLPPPFSGICEADETFVGGQWKNKRRSIRRLGTKKGHGTSKTPVVGVLCRATGQVRVKILAKRSGLTYWEFIRSALADDCKLYTDGYKMNRGVVNYGIIHDYVDHHAGEYVRGDVHTNGIEGFWGYLKRNLATIGGIRTENLGLFVGEFVWRYNYRKIPHHEQLNRLLQLIFKQ